ncbi:hypothetical protein OROMI_011235 [Orobanche minor]
MSTGYQLGCSGSLATCLIQAAYPHFHDLPALEKMELKVVPGPSTEHWSREEEVTPLTRDKKRKMVEAATLPIKEAPAQPIVDQPAKEVALPARQAVVRGEPRHGMKLLGRDLEEYARARSDDPNHLALVTDFLTARLPQHEVDVPSHVARVLDSLPKAWMSELEMITRHELTDSVQAIVTLALQAVTIGTKVAADYESRPSVSILQANLEASRKNNAELAERLMNLEKASLEAEKRANMDHDCAKSTIDRLRERWIATERSLKGSQKDAADLTGSLERLAGEFKSSQAEVGLKVAELDKKEADLWKVSGELAGLREE